MSVAQHSVFDFLASLPNSTTCPLLGFSCFKFSSTYVWQSECIFRNLLELINMPCRMCRLIDKVIIWIQPGATYCYKSAVSNPIGNARFFFQFSFLTRMKTVRDANSANYRPHTFIIPLIWTPLVIF